MACGYTHLLVGDVTAHKHLGRRRVAWLVQDNPCVDVRRDCIHCGSRRQGRHLQCRPFGQRSHRRHRRG